MRLGFSGHQWRHGIDWRWVQTAVEEGMVRFHSEFEGLCSLSAGADQVFARCVLAQPGHLVVVIPRDDYETFFEDPSDLLSYRELLGGAHHRVELHCNGTPEESFFLAGRYIANNADALMAVWDGKPAQGLGGTADIVRIARRKGRPILHINPVSHEIRGSEKWCSLFS